MENEEIHDNEQKLNGDNRSSSPKDFTITEPLKDPYTSDCDKRNTSEKEIFLKKYEKKENICHKQEDKCMQNYIIAHKMNISYKTEGCGKQFMQETDLSINKCLTELLDFALLENSDRRRLSNGTVLFDDLPVEELVLRWSDAFPTIKWLLQNFTHNIRTEELGLLDIFNLQKEKKHSSSGFLTNEKQNLLLDRRCSQFVVKFCDIIHLLQASDYETIGVDELHDRVKSLLSLLSNMIDVPYSMYDEFKSSINVSELVSESGCDIRKQHTMTCDPDLVFRSADSWLVIPVQIYSPKSSMNILSGSNIECFSQDINHYEMIFKGQHTMQHLCFLHKKMKKLLSTDMIADSKQQLTSVGMFVHKSKLHFTKVRTTIEHMMSCITDLLPLDIQENEFVAKMYMKKLNKQNGIEVVKSKWYLDLSNGVHRNAFLLFLVHYILAYDVPAIVDK